MIEALGIGLSGLQKATQRVEAAATNIANLTTPRDDGVTIDLSEEAVNLLLAETEFKANLATIRTTDELSEELLNIFDDEA